MQIKNKLYSLITFTALLLSGCATHIPLDSKCTLPTDHISIPIKDQSTRLVPCDKTVTVFCKPLMLSEIRLPPNENILSINAGDSERWLFQTIISGTTPITHILIKPKESNLKTNLIIATNNRLFRINLISQDNGNYQNSVTFYNSPYGMNPDCTQNVDNHYEVTIPYLQRVPHWIPRSIYNDGKSVFIHIPDLDRDIAPSFYVINKNNQLSVVNYQINNNYYRIDQLFTKAVMMQGVGGNQVRVNINYVGSNE